MATFRVGAVLLGRYEVTSVLGEGGMGTVVAADDRELGRRVALKFLRAATGADDATRERILREARTALRLQGEHAVRVLDVSTADGIPFIVMEFLKGRDLAAEIRAAHPLPVARAVDLLLQACEAIAEAHRLRIVHRDLKPANLFLTTGADGTDHVKVLDFGIAKSTAAGDAPGTASQVVAGTPRYMSPEQLLASKNIDARSDVWALGAILYEMLAAETPYAGDSVGAVSVAVFGDAPFKPLSSRRPDVPGDLEEVVAAALARDPEKRIASVNALAGRIARFGSAAARASLERIERIAALPPPPDPESPDATVVDPPRPSVAGASTGGPVSGSVGEVAPAPRRSRWRRTIAIAALGVVVAAAAAGSITIFGRNRSIDSLPAPPSAQSAAPPAPPLPLPTPPVASDAQSPAPVCPLVPDDGDTECHRCRNERCCPQFLTATSTATYADYKGCINACNTKKCKDNCNHEYPQGHAAGAPLFACANNHCLAECAGKNAKNTCVGCQYAYCRDDAVACFSDADCDTLFTCDDICGDRNDTCNQNCAKQASVASREKVAVLEACTRRNCAQTCGD